MSGAPVRLAIASPHEIVAKGLRSMLSGEPQRVVLVDHEPDDTGSDRRVDVVLHDAIAGADARAVEVLAARTGAAVLLLAGVGAAPGHGARQPLVPGAFGWVSLQADAEEILARVEAAAAETRVTETRSDRRDDDRPMLSLREVEVLALIADGLTNQEIADRMFISINSVKTYIRSAYRKIGVNSRSRAVAWCLQHGVRPSPSGS